MGGGVEKERGEEEGGGGGSRLEGARVDAVRGWFERKVLCSLEGRRVGKIFLYCKRKKIISTLII